MRQLKYNTNLDEAPFSVFEDIESEISKLDKSARSNFISLHQGKTTLNRMVDISDWADSEFPLEPYEHASPNGVNILKQSICAAYPGLVEDNLVITCGATHGIKIALSTILDPKDEVMVLSPQWLFIFGIIKSLNATPVEVPIFIELSADQNFNLLDALTTKLTKKTKAIYFNTPNNPTGYSLNAKQLNVIASFAKKNGLWIISDNAYENYDYTSQGFIDITNFDDARERTISVYTYSKTHLIPGFRVGFLHTPEILSQLTRKHSLFSVYTVSTPSQYAAFKALQISKVVLEERKSILKKAAAITNVGLHIPHTHINGGFYTFLDLNALTCSTSEFIHRCILHGLSLAPGIAFGNHCNQYARLCFTAVDEKHLLRAIEILNKLYAQFT